MTPDLTVLASPGAWSHEHVVWWAVWLRQWGYTGTLPRWARHTCTAVYPADLCPCGMYRVQWCRDA